MLTSSFIFAPGITDEMEQSLWARGVTSWDALEKHPGEANEALGEARGRRLLAAVHEAREALVSGDRHWFRIHWPEREMWRLWRGFCADAERALVDIETTGRTPGYDQITVIGLSDGVHERAFVALEPQEGDEALADYLEAIKAYRLIVTFNGASFDLPFIEQHFRAANYRCEQPHLDLIHPARALGLSGGLKDMEKQVGIQRDGAIADMRGSEAISLWGLWSRNRDHEAYRKLVVYCKADCTNLRDFADHIYRRKWAETFERHARQIDLDAAYGEQTSLF